MISKQAICGTCFLQDVTLATFYLVPKKDSGQWIEGSQRSTSGQDAKWSSTFGVPSGMEYQLRKEKCIYLFFWCGILGFPGGILWVVCLVILLGLQVSYSTST